MLRAEYPRPQFQRQSWLCLNGVWEFEFDDENRGLVQKWYKGTSLSRQIQVPFCYQSALSGINDRTFHDIVWYRREIGLPEAFRGKQVWLHFGAVDYAAMVWVNGQLVARHEGGHTPFSADITGCLDEGGACSATIVVRAQDYSLDLSVPRGKQYWKEQSESIFYTGTTGIWQTVWLEPVEPIHVQKVKLTPDLDANEIAIDAFVAGDRFGAAADVQLETSIMFEGELIARDVTQVLESVMSRRIKLVATQPDRFLKVWSPEAPNLYNVELVLRVEGRETDRVASYFGLRKISIEQGELCLNNRPYYMKLVLDQGYFPEGLLTAPSDEALRQDVELTKAMGFNGARKHQKIEDPRYLYWCDRLGLLVWGEMANAYVFSGAYVNRMTSEWQEAVERDYNHPCLVAWVPLNESWGVPDIMRNREQQHHATAMYHLTKSLDSTRPVISNDGWEHAKSDMLTIHDYESREDVLSRRYSSVEQILSEKPCKRSLYMPGVSHAGEPILVTEFGGISFRKSEWEGWGYSAASDERDYVERVAAVVRPLLQSVAVKGYCYTQLTDVEQEINGLLTYDRQAKVPLEWIRLINEGKPVSAEAVATHMALRAPSAGEAK
ncbi:glycoside hydrolase family 2 protein [Paenibacillus koleovorans]|uniref:glycoside hydrolase family 2 protein n=1 Tax=Paenibacillus koleovorans TaxID=121608 RepID=UPI000FD88EF5|nr:sugar-binding domain-containing protein [Paenibacillus koleovorans]